MKLKAKVLAVESESIYSDGRQRIRIRFENGEAGFRDILIPNEGFNIDDELVGTLNVDILAKAEQKIKPTTEVGTSGGNGGQYHVPSLPIEVKR